MTRIDGFESVFKAAAKPHFRYQRIEMDSVAVVTDLEPDEARAFGRRVRSFLRGLSGFEEQKWCDIAGSEVPTVGDLLERLERESPDLVCTYRNLNTRAWIWGCSLGDRLDVLAQAIPTPILVLPHPEGRHPFDYQKPGNRRVSVLTDRVTGDDRLINYGVRFTEPGGTLYLTHVENQTSFERIMDVIAKLPEIDTDSAREAILARLLKEPRDYIASCREALATEGVDIRVEEVVKLGRHLRAHLALIEAEDVELTVLKAKDEDQIAMHGLAYPIAVELRHIPILLL